MTKSYHHMKALPLASHHSIPKQRVSLDAIIVGPDQGEDPYQEGSRKNFSGPPLGAYTVAHFAESQGFKARVWDPNLEGKDRLYNLIAETRPPVLGFSILHETLDDDVRNIAEAKRASPDSTIVIGGFEATLNWRQLFQEVPMIDAAVLGMGEKTFANILRNAQQGSGFNDVPGIVYRDARGKFIETEREMYSKEDFVRALNVLDFARVPYQRYWDAIAALGRTSLNTIRIMLTANDCNYNCSFCTVPEFWSNKDGKRIQKGPILEDSISVAQLVRAARLQPTTQAFYIEDDNFLMDPLRMEAVAKGVIQAKKEGELREDIKFFCQLRAESLMPNTLNVMRDAGFTVISLGIESFAPSVLDELSKAGEHAGAKTVKKWNDRLEMILGVPGLSPSMFMILFTPQSKVSDVKLTMDGALRWVDRG
ncbi:MAG TPA: cobalamin-dependent protein, partial [Candidatus Nanoarchaeia archaeon]|nr:cobalamin-dependent protein [Candidatus Nanoarchaeia archaeon]